MKKDTDGSLTYSSNATPKGPRARRAASNTAWFPGGSQTRAEAARTEAEQMRMDSVNKSKGLATSKPGKSYSDYVADPGKPRGWGVANLPGSKK